MDGIAGAAEKIKVVNRPNHAGNISIHFMASAFEFSAPATVYVVYFKQFWPVAPAPDSRAVGTATAPPGLPTPEVVVPPGGATPPEAGVESPGEGDAPEAKTPAEVDPGSDHTPPALQLLRFDPPVVEAGNVTTLTVQASDDLSSVKSVRGEIRSPNRSALLPFGSGEFGSGGVSTFPITIPRQAESGVWYVSWISLTDGAANASLVQAPSAAAAPPGGTLTVSSSESDSSPPEVLQVWFDKGAVDGGEKNVIRVEASDDSSGPRWTVKTGH